jgi:hypothetical protein
MDTTKLARVLKAFALGSAAAGLLLAFFVLTFLYPEAVLVFLTVALVWVIGIGLAWVWLK